MRRIAPLYATIMLAGTLGSACAPVETQAPASRVRTYYVAADEVAWDYAPSGKDQVTGAPFSPISGLWTTGAPEQLGRVYKKALFREYTDGSFKTLKPRAPEWEHLGFLGPLLRAEVGDTIHVILKNNTRRPVSLHPHGVSSKKDSAAAPYNGGTGPTDRADGGVPTGGQHTYEW